MALFRLRILVKVFVRIHFFVKTIIDIALKLTLKHLFTIISSINRQEYTTLSHVFVRIMTLFWPIPLFFKTIRNIAYTLTILINHHYLHQQTRVHSSVKFILRIMALFRSPRANAQGELFWPQDQLHPNFPGMFLWWPSFKIVQRFKFHWELWLSERGQNVWRAFVVAIRPSVRKQFLVNTIQSSLLIVSQPNLYSS